MSREILPIAPKTTQKFNLIPPCHSRLSRQVASSLSSEPVNRGPVNLALVTALVASLLGIVFISFLVYRVGKLLRFKLRCVWVEEKTNELPEDGTEKADQPTPPQRQKDIAVFGPFRLSRSFTLGEVHGIQPRGISSPEKRRSFFKIAHSPSLSSQKHGSFFSRCAPVISSPPKARLSPVSNGPFIRPRTRPPPLDSVTRNLYDLADSVVGPYSFPAFVPVDHRQVLDKREPNLCRMVMDHDARVGIVAHLFPERHKVIPGEIGIRYSQLAITPPPREACVSPLPTSQPQTPRTSARLQTVPATPATPVLDSNASSIRVDVHPPTPPAQTPAPVTEGLGLRLSPAPSLSAFPLPPSTMAIIAKANPSSLIARPIPSRSETAPVLSSSLPHKSVTRGRAATISTLSPASASKIPIHRNRSPLKNVISASCSLSTAALPGQISPDSKSYSAFNNLIHGSVSDDGSLADSPPRSLRSIERAPLAPRLVQHSRFSSADFTLLPAKSSSMVLSELAYQLTEGTPTTVHQQKPSTTKRKGRQVNGKENVHDDRKIRRLTPYHNDAGQGREKSRTKANVGLGFHGMIEQKSTVAMPF